MGGAMDFTNISVSRSESGETIIHIEVSAESVTMLLTEVESVLQKYNAERTDEAPNLIRDCIVNASLDEALRREGLDSLVTPDVCVESFPAKGVPFAYEARIVERPQLSLSSIEPVEVHLNQVAADDTYVSLRLADYMESFTQYEDADSCPVKIGDCLFVDLTTLKNGVPFLRFSGKGKVLQVDYGDMPVPFVDGILGMNVGEKRTIEYELQRERAISETDTDKYVSIVEIKKQLKEIKQDITDEWVAKNFAPLSSASEFLARFKEKVIREAEIANFDALSRQVNIELEGRLVGAIPDRLYELSAKQQMDEFESTLKQKGKSLEEYLADNETNMEELSVKLFARAGEGLRQAFALETLFDMRRMSLTDDDLDVAAREIFRKDELTWSRAEKSRLYPLVASAAKRMKALQWLVNTAQVVPVLGEETAFAESR